MGVGVGTHSTQHRGAALGAQRPKPRGAGGCLCGAAVRGERRAGTRSGRDGVPHIPSMFKEKKKSGFQQPNLITRIPEMLGVYASSLT